MPECIDHVGAELDRPLQRRRAEAVVDRAARRRRRWAIVGQRADVADLGQRVGRRLGEQQPACSAAPRRATASTSVCETKRGLDAELGELLPNSLIVEPNTLCEQITWSPAFSSAHAEQQDRAMPLAVRDARLGAFERGQPALDHRHRRVGEARVDEGLFLVGEARAPRSRRRAGRSCWSGTAPRSSRPTALGGRPSRTASVSRRAVRRQVDARDLRRSRRSGRLGRALQRQARRGRRRRRPRRPARLRAAPPSPRSRRR